MSLKVYKGNSINNSGYTAGGYLTNYVNDVEKLNFDNDTNNLLTIVLTSIRDNLGAVTSIFAIYFVGGRPLTGVIDKLNHITDVILLITSTISSKYNFATSNSSTNAYFAGGYTTGIVNEIQKLNYPTEDTSVLTIVLSQAKVNAAGVSTENYGYYAGGYGWEDNIEKLDHNQETIETITATLTTTMYGMGSCNSKEAGYFAGGQSGAGGNDIIQKLNFSTEARTTLASVLTGNRVYLSGMNSISDGYFVGGANTDIFKLDFSTEVIAVLSATLSSAKSGTASTQTLNL